MPSTALQHLPNNSQHTGSTGESAPWSMHTLLGRKDLPTLGEQRDGASLTQIPHKHHLYATLGQGDLAILSELMPGLCSH